MPSPATHRVDRVDLRLYASGSGDASPTPYEPVVRWWFRDHTDDELGRVAAAGGRDSRDAALELTRRHKRAEALNEEAQEDAAVAPITSKERKKLLADLGLWPVTPGTGPNVGPSPPSTASRPHPVPTR